MNYKLQIHFLNDVTMWRTHVPALINMDIIKSPLLHQCRLHSNGNGFKIVQKDFIRSSSNLHQIFKKHTTLASHVYTWYIQKIVLNMTIIYCIIWPLWPSYFSLLEGPHTAIYYAATKYNMAVLGETL